MNQKNLGHTIAISRLGILLKSLMLFCGLGVGFQPGVIRAQGKDTLTIAIAAEFETLNPIIMSQAAASYIMYMALRPAFVMAPNGKFVPTYVKTLPTFENKMVRRKGSKMEFDFEILKSAKWGDGTPLTCSDLHFSWQVGSNPNVSVPDRTGYTDIEAIDSDPKNPKKCKVVLKKVSFEYLLALPRPMPRHLEEKVFNDFKGKPEGYDFNSNYVRNPTNPGLWFGPYLISEVKLGSHVVLTPNPHFYGKKPYFKRIMVKLLPNSNTHIANLKSGSIDMISSAGGLSLDQAVAFGKEVAKDKLPYNVVFVDGSIYAHIDFKLEHPILSDLRVRKAISHAINKEEMVKNLLEGKASPAISNVTPLSPWYSTKTNKYEFNKRKAMTLLEEAGWKVGPDRYRVKDGKKLTLTLIAASGQRVNDLIQTYIQSQLKSVGIEIIIKSEPARVYFGETIKKRNFEMALYSWVSLPESSPRSTLHSGSIPSEANAWSGQNNPGWKNATVDKLIDQVEQELDSKKRAVLGRKIIDEYTKDIPVLPLYYRSNNSIIPAGLKGFELSPHLHYETLNVENWIWQ